jgi:hypothetical protein
MDAIITNNAAPAFAYYPLSPWEDHTVYTTTDDITIAISASTVSSGASGTQAQQGTQLIHEVVTTTTDSLTGTITKKVVTSTQPDSLEVSPTAAQSGAVAGGKAQVSAKVTISDVRTTTETEYATTISGQDSKTPSIVKTVSTANVANIRENLTQASSSTYAVASNAPSVDDTLQRLASTYTDDSKLATLLTGPYAPQFFNLTA